MILHSNEDHLDECSDCPCGKYPYFTVWSAEAWAQEFKDAYLSECRQTWVESLRISGDMVDRGWDWLTASRNA